MYIVDRHYIQIGSTRIKTYLDNSDSSPLFSQLHKENQAVWSAVFRDAIGHDSF